MVYKLGPTRNAHGLKLVPAGSDLKEPLLTRAILYTCLSGEGQQGINHFNVVNDSSAEPWGGQLVLHKSPSLGISYCVPCTW